MAGHKKGYYVRIRKNPSWEQVGEIGPFTTEKIALTQAKNMPSPAPGFVINVEADSAKVRGARKIGNSRRAGAVVSNPLRLSDADKKAIAAFADQRPHKGGRMVYSTGDQLQKLGMGGGAVAFWSGGQVHLRPSSVKSDDTIERALRRAVPRAYMAGVRSNPARRTVAPKAPDTIAADDLVLFAETTYALYGTKQSIVADLVKKWKKGTYDEHKAAKLWLHWFDEAARAYNREFGRGNTMAGFDKPTREYAAASMARGTTIAFSRGNFAEVYPA